MITVELKEFDFVLPDGILVGKSVARGTKPPKIAPGTMLYMNPILIYRYFREDRGATLDSMADGIRLPSEEPIHRDFRPAGVYLRGVFFKQNPKKPFYYQTGIFFPSRRFSLEYLGSALYAGMWTGFLIPRRWEELRAEKICTTYQDPKNLDDTIARICALASTTRDAGAQAHRIHEAYRNNVGESSAITRVVLSHMSYPSEDLRLTKRARLIKELVSDGSANLQEMVRIINYSKAHLSGLVKTQNITSLTEVKEVAESKRYR